MDHPCFGLACPSHAQCIRYHAVETSEERPIDTCETWDHRYPLFELLPAESEGGEAD